ncbi:disease resistance protein RGA2 [Brachypodium distachyon]|uniref:Disease resistance N-terminal domain-containing protein n=1 Tax=Brachypodium distachyon TaxID=15368 RepID=A0A2K2CQ16_BRADI|nr:disease resistance protein RGA2 [Brachypodium distachyon]PNT64137.1 hypothetical protein BRADI_4g24852v3 [Brachypodium distachyon]|eukprot:XP_014758193.1 disease resistance protein RGA2 [Brachypodium distachyon]
MEVLISAVAGDLISRFISFLAQSYGSQTCEEDDRRRLERLLLRIQTVVEEAEGRHITNQGMFLQLKTLIEGIYLGYYMLDRLRLESLREESIDDDQVSRQSQSFTVSTFNTAKRRCFHAAGTKSTRKLKGVLECLETKITDMREFVMLLGNCPRLPHQPYSTYMYIDKCMFGRHIEKEQLINFLLYDSHDFTDLSILPIIGPHQIGKKTLVQHVCKDKRVHDHFSHMFFFRGEDLRKGEFLVNGKAASGKYLFVVDFSRDVDEAAWTKFRSYLKVPSTGTKIVLIGRAEQVANLGTARPIRLKCLSQEEYWYYFKALSFGSMDPDEHPKLVSLGMQLATELNGSLLAANVLGQALRANPNAPFWQKVLLSMKELVRVHMFAFGIHLEFLLERNSPVNFTKLALVGGRSQGYLVYQVADLENFVIGFTSL